MSLSLLLPPKPPRQSTFSTSTSYPLDPSPSSNSSSTTDVSTHLELLTRAFITSFNDRSCAEFKRLGEQHFSRSFRVGGANSIPSSSSASSPSNSSSSKNPCQYDFAEMLVRTGEKLRREPERKLEILGVEVVIHDNEKEEEMDGMRRTGRKASVYLFTEGTGCVGGVVRRNVSVLRWGERKGQWKCARWEVVRGIGGPWVGEE